MDKKPGKMVSAFENASPRGDVNSDKKKAFITGGGDASVSVEVPKSGGNATGKSSKPAQGVSKDVPKDRPQRSREEEALAMAVAKLQQYRDDFARVQLQLKDKEAVVESLSCDITKSNEQIAQLTLKLQTETTRADDARTSEYAQKKRNEELTRQLQDLQAEYERLKGQLEKNDQNSPRDHDQMPVVKAADEEVEKLKHRIEALEEDISRKERDASEASAAAASSEDKRQQLEKERDDLKQRVGQSEARLSILESEKVELQRQNRQHEQQITELKKEREQQETALVAAQRQQQVLQELQQEMRELEVQNQNLVLELQSAHYAQQEQQHQHHQQRIAADHVAAKLNTTLEEKRLHIEKLEQQLQQVRQEATLSAHNLHRQQQQDAQMLQQLQQQLQEVCAQRLSMQQEAKDAGKKLQDAEMQVQSLRSHVELLEKTNQDMAQQQRQILTERTSKLQQLVQKQQEQIQQHEKDIKKERLHAEHIKTKVADLERFVEEVQQRREAAELREKQQQQHVAVLEASWAEEFKMYAKQKEDLEDVVRALKGKNEQLQQQLVQAEKVRSRRSQAEAESSDVKRQREVKRLEEEVFRLTNELDVLKKQKEAAEAMVGTATVASALVHSEAGVNDSCSRKAIKGKARGYKALDESIQSSGSYSFWVLIVLLSFLPLLLFYIY